MELGEIFNNFLIATSVFAVVTILYLIFVFKHPYSKKAKAAIESPLKGLMIEATLWFVIAFVAIGLTSQNMRLASVFGQVVGTTIVIPIVAWSLIIVPITFSIHNAHKGFDYRAIAIGAFPIISVVLGVYYWFAGV